MKYSGPLLIFAGFAVLGAAVYFATQRASSTVKESQVEVLAGKANVLLDALGLKGAGE